MLTVKVATVELVTWNSAASAAAPGANIVAARFLGDYVSIESRRPRAAGRYVRV